MRVHGRYSRAEIEAAFGVLTADAPWIHREGVLWHQPSATDLLFITLRKCKALFSPSTRYRDLALGPWRSACGWSGRFRRYGCLAVPRQPWRSRFEGKPGLH